MTEWRDIPGYDGAYQISNTGKVLSWRGPHGRVKVPHRLAQYTRKRGTHLFVELADGRGNYRDVSVLDLMVKTWLGERPAGMVPYYRDGDPKNNHVENIGFTNRVGSDYKFKMKVAKVNRDGEVVAVYSSANVAAKENFLSSQAVRNRCNGLVKKAYLDGYTYRYY